MEKLKALFGTEALTFEQLEEKLKDNKEVKLANLASGGYVDTKKYEAKVSELEAANTTINGLKETVAKFDGVDVEKLKAAATDWENKYNTDVEAAKVDSILTLELVNAKAKNPTMVKKMLDMSLIKRDGEKLLGLEEQLKTLKESDGYAFNTDDQQGATVNTGGTHGGTNNIDTFMAAFNKGAGMEVTKGE